MGVLYYGSSYFTTSLNVGGGIDDSQTTGIVIQSVAGLDITKPGICIITYANPLDTSTAEWITYTSINGSNELQGVTRGAEGYGAHSHLNTAVIAFPLSKSHINNLNNMFDVALDMKEQATAPTTPSANYGKIYLGNGAVDPDKVPMYITDGGIKHQFEINNSLFRQALINGNFDVWQRGASIVKTAADGYTADRWYVDTATAGDDKTVSRQDGTGVTGSRYCARVQRTAGETGHTVLRLSQALDTHDSIMFIGKKLTFSFYARKGANFSAASDILTATITTGGGTDQKLNAFTSADVVITENKTLTANWTKYSVTTTNVIGAAVTQIAVSLSFDPVGTAGAADYFEVTQANLNAGDIALLFMPQSFDDVLKKCLRYYWKSFSYTVAPATAAGYLGGIMYVVVTTGTAGGSPSLNVFFPVKMRVAPTVTFYNPTSANAKWYNRSATADSGAAALAFSQSNEGGFMVFNPQVAGDTAGHTLYIQADADGEF